MTTVSDESRTSWLEAQTETFPKRPARSAATAALRGDNRMAQRRPPSELSPVTIAAVMAPVPMNPRVIGMLPIVPEGSRRAGTGSEV